MAIELKNILVNITTITENIDTNKFITNARKAFKDDIALYEINDDEKAKLIATFEAQLSVGVISQIIQLAKEFPLLKQQVETEKNKAADIAKATELRDKQIDNEDKRGKDIEATINVKNQDAKFRWQQAKFEEAKRHLEIKANSDNTYIRKAMIRAEEMGHFMMNDSYDVSEDQIAASKEVIDQIPVASVIYVSDLTDKPMAITINETK